MLHEKEQFLESQSIFPKIRELLRKSNFVRIAVAYLTNDGYNELESSIHDLLRNNSNNKIKIIVGLSSYCITEPAAVQALKDLQTAFSSQVTVKYYYNEGFHPKLFIFEHGSETSCIIGSSNLTWQGLNSNVEANVILTRSALSPLVISIQDFFENLLNHADCDLETAIRKYNRLYQTSMNRTKGHKSGKEPFLKTSLPPQFFKAKKDIQTLLQNCKVLWKIAPGSRGYEWNEWINSDGDGRIAIGWDDVNEVGRLDKYESKQELKDYIETHRKGWNRFWREIGERGGKKDPSGYVAGQLWRFYKETEVGNLVIAYSNKTIYALGVIDGEYDYMTDPKFYCHRKSVKWIAIPRIRISLELAQKIGFRQTIFPIESAATIKQIFKLLLQK